MNIKHNPELIGLIRISELSAKYCSICVPLLCTTFGVNCTVGLHLPNKIYSIGREIGSPTEETAAVYRSSVKPQGKKLWFLLLEGFPLWPLPGSPHNKNELFLPLEALLAASAVAEELQHQLPKTMPTLKSSLNCHTCMLCVPICLIMIVDMNIHSAHGNSFIDFTDTVGLRATNFNLIHAFFQITDDLNIYTQLHHNKPRPNPLLLWAVENESCGFFKQGAQNQALVQWGNQRYGNLPQLRMQPTV